MRGSFSNASEAVNSVMKPSLPILMPTKGAWQPAMPLAARSRVPSPPTARTRSESVACLRISSSSAAAVLQVVAPACRVNLSSSTARPMAASRLPWKMMPTFLHCVFLFFQLNNKSHSAGRDELSGRYFHLLDNAFHRTKYRIFHFHRFQDAQNIVFTHLLACYHCYADDFAWDGYIHVLLCH